MDAVQLRVAPAEVLRRWALVCAVILLAGAGCGEEKPALKDRAIVTGLVTFDGKPLTGGSIMFNSAEKPVATRVTIKVDGTFDTDRAPLGKNLVAIETESVAYSNPASYVKIPEKYADPTKSGLAAEIKLGDNENVNFDLQP